jgi:hypothetical protein
VYDMATIPDTPVESMTKRQLVDELAPALDGVQHDVATRRALERAGLMKRPRLALIQSVVNRRFTAADAARVKPFHTAEYERLVRISIEARAQWRRVLRREAASAGVSMPPVTTRLETAAALALKTARKAADAAASTARHLYAPLLRPPSHATVPEGWELIERGTLGMFPLRTDLPEGATPHGVIAYTRPLTSQEVLDYSLIPYVG